MAKEQDKELPEGYFYYISYFSPYHFVVGLHPSKIVCQVDWYTSFTVLSTVKSNNGFILTESTGLPCFHYLPIIAHPILYKGLAVCGTLKLYTTHPIKPEGPECRPEYIMTQLGGWNLTGDPEAFWEGASVYRTARHWAKETREELTLANERHLDAQSQYNVGAQHFDNANNTEYPNAPWSFEPRTEDMENPRRPRANGCSFQ